ncbi:hypothetical protein DDZ14_10455 [Maritimibacter sp. 55A14]|uniref:hypothetical protein n=1 Tax=Maritimibacter sp. 55A14 TaxID=2174844 RepID=UPI000D6194A1|nr:hypothetical protein [Maritimibacter sp. 55A14]PWE32474.1 hypothetical protein DDZ14_10455 [Maritimibacter sp. 55A14]
MPLHVLIPLVVLGISGIVILTHLMGLSRPRVFRDAAAARAAWLRQYPEDEDSVRDVQLSDDARAALVLARSGPGLAWTIGIDTTARPLAGARITEDKDGLIFRFPDFAAPRLHVRLAASESRARWSAAADGAAA